MRVEGERGVMSETNGVTLLYELGDVGYGVMGWICKGVLFEKNPSYRNDVQAWLEKRLTLHEGGRGVCACGNVISPDDMCEGCAGLV